MAQKQNADPNDTARAADPAATTESPAFPNIGEPHPAEQTTYLGEFKTREEAEAGYRALNEKVAGFERWQNESQERERRLTDQINRLISSAPAGGSPQLTQHDDLSIKADALPDPVENPDGFRRGLAETIQRAVEGGMSRVSAAQSRSGRVDALYADFKTRHQELAKYDPVVRQAAIAESQAIQARGGDPAQAMFADPDGFIDRVANTTRRMLKDMGIDPAAKPEGNANADAGEGNGAPPNRTGGIPGGGAAPAAGMNGHPVPKSFSQELKDMQVRTGFF